MNRWHAFRQLVLARVREFYREPVAIFWVYGFPLILAVSLGIAFMGGEPDAPTVDVQDGPDIARAARLAELLAEKKLTVAVQDAAKCRDRLAKGQTALFIIPRTDKLEFVYDPLRSESLLARQWVEAVVLRDRVGGGTEAIEEIKLEEPGSRYIDFLLPGLIGMNIMGGGLFGLGLVIVDMRARKLFKRLMATPVRRPDFLLAMLTARLLFLLPEMLALLLAGRFLFGVPIKGSLFTLLLVILAGAFAFAGIGLLIGCRTEKNETISGLINLVMLPMYLVSGIFFPSERFPEVAQPVIQALPLTQLNNALREVMLYGGGVEAIVPSLAILTCWAGVTFALALRWFRWN